MGFSRQECWSGLPFPPPGDLPDPGIEPTSLMSPALAGRFFTLATPGQPSSYFLPPPPPPSPTPLPHLPKDPDILRGGVDVSLTVVSRARRAPGPGSHSVPPCTGGQTPYQPWGSWRRCGREERERRKLPTPAQEWGGFWPLGGAGPLHGVWGRLGWRVWYMERGGGGVHAQWWWKPQNKQDVFSVPTSQEDLRTKQCFNIETVIIRECMWNTG